MKFTQFIIVSTLASVSATNSIRGSTSSEPQPPCCVSSCEKEGETKYISIDVKTDLCGETCMNPFWYPIFKLFEKGLVKANDDDSYPCSTLGYTKYLETVTHGGFGLYSTLDLYDHSSASPSSEILQTNFNENKIYANDCTVEYKLDGNTCGELCLSSTIAPFAEKFGGVTKGNCKDLGFVVFDHEETISMGPFGESTVTVYTK